jgi:long-chain acyl-CoA synthetase
MQAILARIARIAGRCPSRTALADGRVSLTYRELKQEIERIGSALQLQRIGLLLANGCPWAILDLAAHHRRAACIPMPSFFSDAQLQHLIVDAGLELIISDQPSRVLNLAQARLQKGITVAGRTLACFAVTQAAGRALPPSIAKITYTSGTTGQPRGACLTGAAMERVTVSLSAAVGAAGEDKSLTLLPFSTLLANIAGIYAPLYSGSTAYVPDLANCGIHGSTAARSDQLIAALLHYQPTVTVVVPHLLKILVEAATQGARLPSSLRYIAVGGAPVSPRLLKRARALGLPVYEGYGLSEAASVVSMNVPGQNCIGSVGRPLPPASVRIAADGEIVVGGNLFSGYLGQPFRQIDEWATGDIGFIDGDGQLHVTGRKNTAFATAHGRKLAPEWIESELTGTPAIAQAAVFGEGRSWNIAVVVPCDAAAGLRIGPDIEAVNRTLPDYARVRGWIVADEPFSSGNGLANGVGVLNRQAIAARYSRRIERLYGGAKLHVLL